MESHLDKKKFFGFFDGADKINIKNEVFAGFTVAMTMIPESLSFAILAGLSPLIGLYAAFIMGIVTAILGGRPGMVSGGAGATIVVMTALIATYGVEYLFAAVILAGFIQLLVGVFKLGKFIRLIPKPVMYGFLNGLAIIIFLAQVSQFKTTQDGVTTWMQGESFLWMAALTALTILLVLIIPKFTKKVPASLLAIIILFGIVNLFAIDTKKVLDIASVSGSLPSFSVPSLPLTWETLEIIFPYALIMAGVGLIESLLTLNMVDEITNTKGKPNKESIAQGVANITNGFFGGMGGCAMVAQTLVNLEAGARTRLAAVIGAITILLVILVAAPVIEQIPLAALVGVMMVVAVSTFEWASFKIIRKMPKQDIIIGILVTAITVLVHNLALAVLVGVILAAIVFSWESSKRLYAIRQMPNTQLKVYEIHGSLFFGSTALFQEFFDIEGDPERVIIDMRHSRVMDMSAIDALHSLTDKYRQRGKTLLVQNVSPECRKLIQDAQSIVNIQIIDEQPLTN